MLLLLFHLLLPAYVHYASVLQQEEFFRLNLFHRYAKALHLLLRIAPCNRHLHSALLFFPVQARCYEYQEEPAFLLRLSQAAGLQKDCLFSAGGQALPAVLPLRLLLQSFFAALQFVFSAVPDLRKDAAAEA